MVAPRLTAVGVDADERPGVGGAARRLGQGILRCLPEGYSLPDEVWERRHAGLVLLLWLHAIALTAYSLWSGQAVTHSLAEGGVLVVSALFARAPHFGRKVRAGAASFGLISASALLVHLSGGYVEMHFHFFVVVALMALYQDW